MLLLVCSPEVLKTLAIIDIDASLKSKENIINLDSLNQVSRAKAVAWVSLFYSVLFYFFVPSEFPKCFVVVLQCFDLDALQYKFFEVFLLF